MLNLMTFVRPGIGELLIILLLIAVILGASKLPKLGSALGEAIKGFRKSVKDDENQG
jgi:sec-independent protein translocase protein TatA